jgi:hypothetical protein
LKKNINRTLIIIISISISLFISCRDEHEEVNFKKITKDYYLAWINGESDQSIVRSPEEEKNVNGAISVIDATVFAIGFNNDFLIAKQHPDKETEIFLRIFKYDENEGSYLLENPNDSLYLSDEDSVYQKNKKWYHISNGWSPNDSLKPYKKITYYHIIDLRNYEVEKNKPDEIKKYTFDNEKDFIIQRKKIGVPNNLRFSIIDKELE